MESSNNRLKKNQKKKTEGFILMEDYGGGGGGAGAGAGGGAGAGARYLHSKKD